MKSTQAQTYGWIAAGVLALGMNGVYHSGGAAWAHRIADREADRPAAFLNMASERFDQFVERVELAAVRAETSSGRLTTAVARAESKIARVQTSIARADTGFVGFEAMSARQEAQLARMEASRARIEVQMARVHLGQAAFKPVKVHVACPQVRVCVPRVNVPQVPMARVPIPVVHIERMGGKSGRGKSTAPVSFCAAYVSRRPLQCGSSPQNARRGRDWNGPLVLVPNPVPSGAKLRIFHLLSSRNAAILK
jgi:hypothetical protein